MYLCILLMTSINHAKHDTVVKECSFEDMLFRYLKLNPGHLSANCCDRGLFNAAYMSATVNVSNHNL